MAISGATAPFARTDDLVRQPARLHDELDRSGVDRAAALANHRYSASRRSGCRVGTGSQSTGIVQLLCMADGLWWPSVSHNAPFGGLRQCVGRVRVAESFLPGDLELGIGRPAVRSHYGEAFRRRRKRTGSVNERDLSLNGRIRPSGDRP